MQKRNEALMSLSAIAAGASARCDLVARFSREMNHNIFPKPILDLPEADMPYAGCRAYLSQGKDHQILFMYFDEDIELPVHSHESQWAIVLEGRIDITIDGKKNTFYKGDRYYIPKGSKHSGKIYAGYADMTYFNQNDRYSLKEASSKS
jgi:mannose-6-phosphate isomerase-like protein (cupin superfamily)